MTNELVQHITVEESTSIKSVKAGEIVLIIFILETLMFIFPPSV